MPQLPRHQARPSSLPLVYQSWGQLLFLHWPMPVEAIRPLIPDRIQIDTFDGSAWVGVVPFTLWGTRPVLLPAVPVVSGSHELNVRTYVQVDGVPGVWFFSLDAANPLLVWGARAAFHLPYFWARMRLDRTPEGIRYRSVRRHPCAPPAVFEAEWSLGEPLPPASPGTLEFFLVERYCLYAAHRGRVYRSRVYHRPWPLCRARVASYASTILHADGLPVPSGDPLIHAQAAPFEAEIWPLMPV
jgi:uncharacterized protein YqjF (DUF2071 family)